MCGDAVGNGVDLTIGVALAAIGYRTTLGRALYLPAEKCYHIGRVVVFMVIVVELVEQGFLCLGGDIDVGKALFRQQSVDHGLITFEKLRNDFGAEHVAVIFGLDVVSAIEHKCFEIARSVQSAVANAFGGHGQPGKPLVGKEVSVPHKHGVGLQVQVVHDIGKTVNLMLAASAHLLLQVCQEVEHGGVVVKSSIDGQCFHRHAHRMVETLVGATVEHGGEK